MEKKLNKSKIIILSIAIVLTILSLSIGVFGITKPKEKERINSDAATEEKIFISIIDPFVTMYKVNDSHTASVYEDSACTILAYTKNNSQTKIYTKKGLLYFCNSVILGTSHPQVSLEEDLIFSNEDKPISRGIKVGVADTPFSGVFDGKGHTIKNLFTCSISGSDSKAYGLFPFISNATIKNLHIDNANWTSTASSHEDGLYAGILIGRGIGNCTIENVLVTNSSLKIEAEEETEETWRVGGLIGSIGFGTINIKNCGIIVDVTVNRVKTVRGEKMVTYVGGMLGHLSGWLVPTTIHLLDSYYIGDIKSTTKYNFYFGGLIGGGSSQSSNIEGNMLQINTLVLNNDFWWAEHGGNNTWYEYEGTSSIYFYANTLFNVGTNFYSQIDSKSISCANDDKTGGVVYNLNYITSLTESGTKVNKLLP